MTKFLSMITLLLFLSLSSCNLQEEQFAVDRKYIVDLNIQNETLWNENYILRVKLAKYETAAAIVLYDTSNVQIDYRAYQYFLTFGYVEYDYN